MKKDKKTKKVDVNRERYLRTLLGEVDKHSKMISFSDIESLIIDFVAANPSSGETGLERGPHGGILLHRI